VGAIDPKFEIYGDIGLAYGTSLVDDDGTRVRAICGDFWGRCGLVEGVAADPRYIDAWVPPGRRAFRPQLFTARQAHRHRKPSLKLCFVRCATAWSAQTLCLSF